MPSDSVTSSSTRSSRLGLRATPEQEQLLRRAAEVSRKSLTDFILDSASTAAEHALLDQRLVLVSGEHYDAILALLDEPARSNQGLEELFARATPWEAR
jgi:uncharacterized protein (DUF1778 family)